MRYLGVVVGQGQYELSQPVAYLSTVAFEWSVNGQDIAFTEVVTPTCKNVMGQGVPGPPSARRWAAASQLHGLAATAAQEKAGDIESAIGRGSLLVACK